MKSYHLVPAIIASLVIASAAQAQAIRQVSPKEQAAPVLSADGKSEYVPTPSSVSAYGNAGEEVVTMLWTVHSKGERSERHRIAVQGCWKSQGIVYTVDANGRRNPAEEPIEWNVDGGAIIDSIARRNCLIYLVRKNPLGV